MKQARPQSDPGKRPFPWGTIIAMTVLILAGLAASQHPQSPFAVFVKMLLAP